jgi:rRNA-processing protein FCF1
MNVICDTSFLMLLVAKPIKQIDKLELQIGKLIFLVPDIVIDELKQVENKVGPKKAMIAKTAIDVSYSKFEIIKLPRSRRVDDAILEYAKKSNCAVATVDTNLRNKLIANNILVITLSKNRLVVAANSTK